MALDVEVTFIDRVAVAVTTLRLARLLLTLIALPFYVLGWVFGLVYVAVLFAVGAVKVGIADVRQRTGQRPAEVST